MADDLKCFNAQPRSQQLWDILVALRESAPSGEAVATMEFTADGDDTAVLATGRDYVVSVSGDFGGGNVEFYAVHNGNDVPISDLYGPVVLDSAGSFVFTQPPDGTLKVVVTGATAPDVGVTVAPA